MPLFLVDGHALAYRSYYAFAGRPLVNSKGEETSATYGFVNTMLALFQRYDPSNIVVAFDARAKTFRHERYDAYKATRTAMPESLAAQIPVIFAVLDAMQIRYLTAPGFEADDIIATLAANFRDATDIRIVSGDKDLFQLVDEKVHVIRPGRGRVLEDELGPDELLEKIGLRPDQVVDYLALIGDTSDNVPGVKGIGEKTAKKLLADYPTLDDLYAHLTDIGSASVRRKLEEHRDDAFMSRELVTLRDDVPLDVQLDDFARRDFRTPEFATILGELEFDRMKDSLFDGSRGRAATRGAPPPPPVVKPPQRAQVAARYDVVDTPEALERFAADIAGLEEIAIDTETTGVDAMRATLAGISVATEAGRAWYVPVSSDIEAAEMSLLPAERAPGLDPDRVRDVLGAPLAADTPRKIGQNIKYDRIVLERFGLPLGGVAFDTMIASYCLDASRRSHGLDALAKDVCGHDMIPFEALFASRARKKDIRTVALDKVTEYACEDADYTLRIKQTFAPMLEASQVRSLFYDVEMPLCAVLTRMEMIGVNVDAAFLGELSRRYASEVTGLEADIYRSVGEEFNINSTPKLQEVLFDRLGLKPARKTKTGYSTDSDVLSGLADQHEVIGKLLRYRQLVKLQGTYIDALPRLIHPETGRVHTSYNQAVASTGRLSSSDPNLQNIPIRTAEGREIRRAFIAREPDWVLLDADYSQIELRILAHLSEDPELVEAFKQDADVHRRTAAKVMGVSEEDVTDDMRARAKTVNFGIVYGMGARGLAQSLGIDVADAQRFIDDYFASYPGVKHFIDDVIESARQHKVATTMMGRLRPLPDIDSNNPRWRSFSERIAINTPVQGTAADIIKVAMLEVDAAIRARGLRSRMILQVHDELLFDVPRDELDEMKALVRDGMEGAAALAVPLKVDVGVGDNWLEAH